MPYATQQNMIDRFGQQELTELTDRSSSGAIDAEVLARCLADADADINVRLSVRYTLPLTAVPEVLVRIACDITRYYLYDDRVTDQVKARFDNAIKLLDAVAAGKASIGVNAALAAPSGSLGAPQVSAPSRVFTHETLSDYG